MAYTILHLIDTTGPGGAEDVFIKLASRLRNNELNSIAVVRGEGYVASSLRKHGIEPVIIDSKGSFNLRFILKMISIIRQYRVNIIQSHLLGSNVYASIVGLLSGVPVVATYHGMVDVSPNERFKKVKLWFMKHGISHFVTVSESLKKAISKQNLLVPSRTSVIYNGVDPEIYCTEKTLRLKKHFNISISTPLFGALGNVRPSKRYDLLLKAACILKKQGVEVAFCIAGDPKATLKTQLDKMIVEYDLDNIYFIGFVENTPEYLSNLDAFVLTSDNEGFSISTIEAMATGLPVIATRCGGPEEIINQPSQGHLVEVSASAIATAIARVAEQLKTNEKANYYNKNASMRIKESFSVNAMLSAYVKVYKAIDVSFPGQGKI